MEAARKNSRISGRIFGFILLLSIVLTALFAPLVWPNDPYALNLTRRLVAPCTEFPLGTDQLGRCVLSRVMAGARISISGSFVASLLSLLVGGTVGVVAALARPWAGLLLTGVIDMALALPGLILALVFAGLMGVSVKSLVIGLVMAGWPWWARLVRDLVLSAREKEFVLAGRVSGVRGLPLVVRYILPQLKSPVLSAVTLKTGWIILAFSGLSYLGLGPGPPAPEWGNMLQASAIYMTQAPWMMMAPGAAVTLTVLALNLIGESLDTELPR